MEMFPHTITIYNRYRAGGQEKAQRTVLSGVYWNSIKGAVTRKTGNAAADGVQLIIPCSIGGYVKPKKFADLSDKTGKWTLGSGDVIILGEIDYIPAKSVSELRNLYDDVLLITSVDTKDFGGGMAHWEVSGK